MRVISARKVRKVGLALLIGFILMIGIGRAMTVNAAAAMAVRDGALAKDAVALAATHPAFAKVLALVPGYTTAAYYTANAFQIWHVEFYTAEQERFGWADVSLTKHRVYSFEAPDPSREPTDDQRRAAEKALQRFVRGSKEIADLIGKTPDDVSIEYNSDQDVWGVSFEQNGEPITLAVKFGGKRFALENPQLYGVYFPEILDYATWLTSQEALAINIAYKDRKVTAVLHGKTDWRGKGTRNEDESWSVVFTSGDKNTALITVQVDINAEKVLSIVQP